MSGVNYNDTTTKARTLTGYLQTTTSAAAVNQTTLTSATPTNVSSTITFTTAGNNEIILLSWTGQCQNNQNGVSTTIFLGYLLDGVDVDVVLCRDKDQTYRNASWAIPVLIAASGVHTVTMRGYVTNVGGASYTLNENSSTPTFKVTQIINQ